MSATATRMGTTAGKAKLNRNYRIFIRTLPLLILLAAVSALSARAAAPPTSYFDGVMKNSDASYSGSHFLSAAIAGATFAPADSQAWAHAAYAKLPLSFVPNAGQIDARVRYSAQSAGKTFYFTNSEAVFAFANKAKGLVLRLAFLDGNPQTTIAGQKETSAKVHYFIGNDPSRWHTNLPTYGEVVYRNLWPGIDLLFRSENGQLNYEFLLKPGARVQDIQLAYRGARDLSVDREGNLIIHTALGNLTDTRPTTYQLIDGQRIPVKSRFALQRRAGSRTTFSFHVGSYDRRRELVLDPGLVYSTYLGGSADDAGNGIAVDTAGQAYVTGNTYSPDFPTTAGAYDRTFNGTGGFVFGGGDVFVTKLNSSGSALVYSTYLGGTFDEPVFGASIAIDRDGNAYITGTTDSPDFPTTPGAFQRSLKGIEDAFITKLNHDGSALVYSTYLGGSAQDDTDFYSSIAVDSSGSAYITGFTQSPDFPTTPGAYQQSFKGVEDAFVTKLNPSGTGLMYSTYLGGTGDEGGLGIALDGDGRAIVTGYTNSPDFPTTPNAAQPVIGGGYDAFVTKLNSGGTGLIYSTFLGGTSDDAAGSIATDGAGSAYVTGSTFSPDFPTTPSAFQKTANGGVPDAFVTKLNPDGSALVYSTYLGGAGSEQGDSIAVDSAGQANVAGFTNAIDFPVTSDAVQPTNNGGSDAFVTKLNRFGSALVYSTYLGGTIDDFGNGIALGRSNKVYVTGSTDSPNFPTTSGAFDTTYNGGTNTGDAFVTKLDVPQGEAGCDKADGDGEADEQNSGRKSHFHFHKKSSCPDQGDNEDDNVEADDDGSGPRFQSTSITSANYTVADTSQAVTIVGAGLHNGLPVNFTVVSVNSGDVAPGVFQITMTDGYTFTGSVVSGAINIY